MDITCCFIDWHWLVVDCSISDVIEILRTLLVEVHLSGLLRNQAHIHCVYALSLSGRLLMRYGL